MRIIPLDPHLILSLSTTSGSHEPRRRKVAWESAGGRGGGARGGGGAAAGGLADNGLRQQGREAQPGPRPASRPATAVRLGVSLRQAWPCLGFAAWDPEARGLGKNGAPD